MNKLAILALPLSLSLLLIFSAKIYAEEGSTQNHTETRVEGDCVITEVINPSKITLVTTTLCKGLPPTVTRNDGSVSTIIEKQPVTISEGQK